MRAIIIDDEEQSRTALRTTLDLLPHPIKIVGEADCVPGAIEQINALQPSLLFLDIQLGDGSGFEVIERCEWKNFQVIFITAYHQYALQAFKVNAQAYLLKPIDNGEVMTALGRLSTTADASLPAHWESLLRYVKNTYEKISFATAEGFHLYTPDEIIRCEADNNYSRIYLHSGEELYVAKTLKELEQQLAASGFERIHKSHLINIRHLRKYLNRDGGSVLMTGGAVLPVAQRKRTNMLQLLSRFSQ